MCLQDLSTMFLSSSMLDDDKVTQEVVNTFVNKIFRMFKYTRHTHVHAHTGRNE